MNIANAYNCALCCDSTCNPIELTCGHVFGKRCLKTRVKSSNLEKCYLCKNPLTDNELNEINNISLQERVVSTSKQAIKLFSGSVLKIVPRLAKGLAMGFGAAVAVSQGASGVAGGASGTLVTCATSAVGAAVASLGVATGVTKANAVAIAAVAAGAVGAAGANLAVRAISTAVGDSTWLDVETAGVLAEAAGAIAGTVVGKCMAGFVYDEQEKMVVRQTCDSEVAL